MEAAFSGSAVKGKHGSRHTQVGGIGIVDFTLDQIASDIVSGFRLIILYIQPCETMGGGLGGGLL